MAFQERQSGNPVIERLLKEFYGFSFFKAVNLIEALSPGKKPLGQTLNPDEEPVRFSVKPGMAFPASDISNLQIPDEEQPAAMEVAFMGLVGPSGVLPYWYNELALERVREKDYSLTAFLDIFHHRLVSLFYLSWKKYRLAENYKSGASDRISRHFLNLIGLSTEETASRLGLPAESLIFCSGLLSRTASSAMALERAVEYFTGTAVQIEQFVERALPLSPEDQTRIGTANSELGMSTICGSYIFESQTKFRVVLGPVKYKEFSTYLPPGLMLPSMFSLIRYMAGIEFEFEIRVILERGEVPPCVLGGDPGKGPQLGLSTWIKNPEVTLPQDPSVTFAACS